jgi:hypothetical protein
MDEREAIRRELEARSTEELTSILRNRDEEEWRPEVFEIVGSILAARGVSPSDVVALGPEGTDVAEGQALVTVGRYFSAVEAHAHRMALNAAGLDAWVCDESVGTMYGVGVGARLQVRDGDETSARAVLEGERAPASALPPEIAEPPCPNCASSDVTQLAEVVESPPSIPPERERRAWHYECSSCGHSWPDERK